MEAILLRLFLYAPLIISIVLFPSLSGAATLKPLVMGKRGVVAAGHPLVAEAGLRILEKGGNAVDAGIATVFAAGVVELGSFGLGGEAPILIKMPGQPVIAINGVGFAPQLATVDYYRNVRKDDPRLVDVSVYASGHPGTIPAYGPLSAIVPGAVDSLLLALEKYGTKSFAEIIQPAIELAQGVPFDAHYERLIGHHRATLEKWPASAKVFLPNGHPAKVGEIFSQPDLARTLQEMAEAEHGAASQGRERGIEAVRAHFYRGPIAHRISEFCKQAGCLLREGDFAAFHARVEQPLTTNYRGVDVYKVGFWSQSPVMLQNLNLLEGFDLKSMGHNSPDYIHTVVEAMKLGYADRDAYYGDPDFSSIPAQLISKDYAKIRRPLINAQQASAEHIPGDPLRMQARAGEDFIKARLSDRNGEHQDTTCVNVIDKDGTTFSATPSGAWAPAFIAGDTGIPLTQRAQAFVLTAGHPNQLAPHKRPRITLTPTIATKSGKPFLAFSTPGGDSQDQTLLQIFLNRVEFNMDPQTALEAPRFNSEAMYSSFDDHSDQPLVLEVEKRVPEVTLEKLRAKGHKITVQGDWDNPTAPTMVEFDPAVGVMKAGADVRGYRYAVGW
jgi:gamma-glutamyltranspeptidase/glutathione hydrolase